MAQHHWSRGEKVRLKRPDVYEEAPPPPPPGGVSLGAVFRFSGGAEAPQQGRSSQLPEFDAARGPPEGARAPAFARMPSRVSESGRKKGGGDLSRRALAALARCP